MPCQCAPQRTRSPEPSVTYIVEACQLKSDCYKYQASRMKQFITFHCFSIETRAAWFIIYVRMATLSLSSEEHSKNMQLIWDLEEGERLFPLHIHTCSWIKCCKTQKHWLFHCRTKHTALTCISVSMLDWCRDSLKGIMNYITVGNPLLWPRRNRDRKVKVQEGWLVTSVSSLHTFTIPVTNYKFCRVFSGEKTLLCIIGHV